MLRVPQAEAAQVTAALLAQYRVDDLTVEDTPIDAVIERVFAQNDETSQRQTEAA